MTIDDKTRTELEAAAFRRESSGLVSGAGAPGRVGRLQQRVAGIDCFVGGDSRL